MYRFRFYYKDGTVFNNLKRTNKPEDLYMDFDGLISWSDYHDLDNKHLNTREILEMAFKLYDFLPKEYYRIAIVNDETDEVVDYIDDSDDDIKKKVYRVKLYFRDGTSKVSGIRAENIESLYNEFYNLMSKDDSELLKEKKDVCDSILHMAIKYDRSHKLVKRAEIINIKSEDVIYSLNIKQSKQSENVYCFKFHYIDGTFDIGGRKVNKPEKLYVDFDGLISWDDYDSLSSKNLSTHEILKMAFDLYDFLPKKYYRIDIINIRNGKVIDYVEAKKGGEV